MYFERIYVFLYQNIILEYSWKKNKIIIKRRKIGETAKVNNNRNILINANKPADKKIVKLVNTEFRLNLLENCFDKVGELNKKINLKRYILIEILSL